MEPKIFGKHGKEKMKINEFIVKYRTVKEYPDMPYTGRKGSMKSSRNPYVICKDGFEMSVQCGQSLYSSPKDVAKRYKEVEIGFPSAPEPLIAEYAEDWEIEGDDDPRLCNTVYGYVPVGLVNKVLKKHGGIDEEAVQAKIKEAA